jgi:hypothetical protein
MAKRKLDVSGPKKPKIPVDTNSEKCGRGRPNKIEPSWVIGRAQNYRWMLAKVWTKLGEPLIGTATEEQVIAAFESHGLPYAQEFVPRFASDILALLRDEDFPKRSEAQIGFLADSLAGRPNISARSSRDICGDARASDRAKSPHKIIRKEFYVECSCGYAGPALEDACRKCGAQISLSLEGVVGPRFF